jgi:hypothetical protein
VKAVIISCIFVLACSSYLHAEDCTKQFTIGEFAFRQSDSVVASGFPYGMQYEPVYMEKREVQEQPEVRTDVYASDVFQLKLTREDRSLLAACYGDLNSDGKRDYALLLRNIADGAIQLRIFIHTPGGYRVIPVQKPVAFKDEPYIPQCIRKPPDGIFIGLEQDTYKVTGDLIRYGWYTYFWEGNGLREILTSD